MPTERPSRPRIWREHATHVLVPVQLDPDVFPDRVWELPVVLEDANMAAVRLHQPEDVGHRAKQKVGGGQFEPLPLQIWLVPPPAGTSIELPQTKGASQFGEVHQASDRFGTRNAS